MNVNNNNNNNLLFLNSLDNVANDQKKEIVGFLKLNELGSLSHVNKTWRIIVLTEVDERFTKILGPRLNSIFPVPSSFSFRVIKDIALNFLKRFTPIQSDVVIPDSLIKSIERYKFDDNDNTRPYFWVNFEDLIQQGYSDYYLKHLDSDIVESKRVIYADRLIKMFLQDQKYHLVSPLVKKICLYDKGFQLTLDKEIEIYLTRLLEVDVIQDLAPEEYIRRVKTAFDAIDQCCTERSRRGFLDKLYYFIKDKNFSNLMFIETDNRFDFLRQLTLFGKVKQLMEFNVFPLTKAERIDQVIVLANEFYLDSFNHPTVFDNKEAFKYILKKLNELDEIELMEKVALETDFTITLSILANTHYTEETDEMDGQTYLDPKRTQFGLKLLDIIIDNQGVGNPKEILRSGTRSGIYTFLSRVLANNFEFANKYTMTVEEGGNSSNTWFKITRNDE